MHFSLINYIGSMDLNQQQQIIDLFKDNLNRKVIVDAWGGTVGNMRTPGIINDLRDMPNISPNKFFITAMLHLLAVGKHVNYTSINTWLLDIRALNTGGAASASTPAFTPKFYWAVNSAGEYSGQSMFTRNNLIVQRDVDDNIERFTNNTGESALSSLSEQEHAKLREDFQKLITAPHHKAQVLIDRYNNIRCITNTPGSNKTELIWSTLDAAFDLAIYHLINAEAFNDETPPNASTDLGDTIQYMFRILLRKIMAGEIPKEDLAKELEALFKASKINEKPPVNAANIAKQFREPLLRKFREEVSNCERNIASHYNSINSYVEQLNKARAGLNGLSQNEDTVPEFFQESIDYLSSSKAIHSFEFKPINSTPYLIMAIKTNYRNYQAKDTTAVMQNPRSSYTRYTITSLLVRDFFRKMFNNELQVAQSQSIRVNLSTGRLEKVTNSEGAYHLPNSLSNTHITNYNCFGDTEGRILQMIKQAKHNPLEIDYIALSQILTNSVSNLNMLDTVVSGAFIDNISSCSPYNNRECYYSEHIFGKPITYKGVKYSVEDALKNIINIEDYIKDGTYTELLFEEVKAYLAVQSYTYIGRYLEFILKRLIEVSYTSNLHRVKDMSDSEKLQKFWRTCKTQMSNLNRRVMEHTSVALKGIDFKINDSIGTVTIVSTPNTTVLYDGTPLSDNPIKDILVEMLGETPELQAERDIFEKVLKDNNVSIAATLDLKDSFFSIIEVIIKNLMEDVLPPKDLHLELYQFENNWDLKGIVVTSDMPAAPRIDLNKFLRYAVKNIKDISPKFCEQFGIEERNEDENTTEE